MNPSISRVAFSMGPQVLPTFEEAPLLQEISSVQRNEIIPSTDQLIDYETFNFIPVSKIDGKFGGSLITVKINPDFDLLQTDKNAREYFEEKTKYLSEKKKLEKTSEEFRKAFREWEARGNRLELPPRAPTNRTLAMLKFEARTFSEKHLEMRKKFPSYSENPDSTTDPQGDINWMLFLPPVLRTLLRFSKDGTQFTFPNIDEINGGIDAINETAKAKGLGENFIPLKLALVKGKITDDQYLSLILQGFLPVAEPEQKKSWFYHDLLYHVVGMLLTPRGTLVKAREFVHDYHHQLNNQAKGIIVSHLDQMTTYALRIHALEYAKSHSVIEFYIFSDGTESKLHQDFLSQIVDFSMFERFNKEESEQFLCKLNNTLDYYKLNELELLRFTISNPTFIQTLTANVNKHYQQLQAVLA